MLLNLNIPGQMSIDELKTISILATMVPENGTIIETGSLFGLSSWHFSKNAHSNVKLYCIDPWKEEIWIKELMKTLNINDFSKENFIKNTKDCNNIIPLQNYSPQDFKTWSEPIDLFFDDAMHNNPDLNRNLNHWLPYIKKGGIIAGHDYTPKWPDVIKEAERIAELYDTEVNTVGSVWWLQI